MLLESEACFRQPRSASQSALIDPKASVAIFKPSDRSTSGNGRSPTSSRKSEFGNSGRSRAATADQGKIAGERLHPKVASSCCRPIVLKNSIRELERGRRPKRTSQINPRIVDRDLGKG